jgi:hypothetical protein
MIYGFTGSGKSQFLTMVIRQGLEVGAKVAMCDTEGNYSGNVKAFLMQNTTYTKTPKFDKVMDWIDKLAKGFDLVVLDSFGAPALGEYARASLKTRGDLLLTGEALAYTVKCYAQENNCMALIANQPVSEMGKARDFKTGQLTDPLAPWGGKAGHYCKEVLWFEKTKQGLISEFKIVNRKSRHMPDDAVLATFKISNTGFHVTFNPYSGTKGKDLPPITVETRDSNGEPEPPPKRKRKKKEPKPELTIEPPEDKPKDKPADDDSPVDVETLQKDLMSLLQAGGIDQGLFTAFAYGAGLGNIEDVQGLKDIDSLNTMIDLANDHIEKHQDKETPASLLDGVTDD